MTGRAFQSRAAIFALAVVAILSTGLPGALHRLSAHALVSEGPAPSHTCSGPSGEHGHTHPTRDSDHDHNHSHSEGSCDLCLMLAAGGQWGTQLASVPWRAIIAQAPALAESVGLIESLPIRARSARGPPMISVG